MATLKLHLLLGTVLIAAAGCASQPQRPDNNVAAPASSGAVSNAAPATSDAAAASFQRVKSAVPSDLLVFAHDQGYKQVVIKGDQYSFCKTEDEIGELIPTRQCLDQTQLESLRIHVRQQQEQLSRRGAETTGISH